MKPFWSLQAHFTIVSITLILLSTLVFPIAVWLELKYNPPMREWKPSVVWQEGRDVIVQGTVVKPRDCSYFPPPRARDEAGQNYFVESASTVAYLTWDNSLAPQKFGPWRVASALRPGHCRTLTFYQEHRCHLLWNLITELGSVEVCMVGDPLL
jgi:hypothetical protein